MPSEPSPIEDRPQPVRRGEELPLEELATWLRRRLGEADVVVDPAAPLVVEQFPSGWSNLTYLLRIGDVELVLRRPPVGNIVSTAHDMAREHRVLSRLSRVWPLAPRPFLYCEDPGVLGVPFYVMERRHGLILRRTLPPGLEVSPARARTLSEAMIDVLASLHGLDFRAAGLADLGRPEGYAERQFLGWSERYRRAATDEHPHLDAVIDWLAGHVPATGGAALVHNDYKYDNLVLDPAEPTKVRAVLDWEMATVGDPLLDLGTTLGYWIQPGDPEPLQVLAMGPTAIPGSLTRRQLAERYAERTGTDVGDLVPYYAFGLFKIAVIVQQIYARYRAGKTTDPRFAGLADVVGLYGMVAAAAIEAGEV
ncbi:MAG TPA: phosphotransferase family protein [Thermoanaerobaculia bacterium]|nr:phosphotransferase family protein [Thermoanaerobaculia bacterium]